MFYIPVYAGEVLGSDLGQTDKDDMAKCVK
jgi:hypothetical protein